MSYESITVQDIVDRAIAHTWSVPEFQRGFVWKATQVRDLAESLWLNYPIGSLLVWNSHGPVETRSATDSQRPSLWVVDGQQPTTALCILFGRKPYWWSSGSEWDKTQRKYDIRFDIDAKTEPYFVNANAVIRKDRTHRYIPLSELLNLNTDREEDQKKLMELAKQIKLGGLCNGMDAMEVYTRLDRVRKIRDKDVVTITVDNELEEVVEIFSRLNSRGTRVREADIYLGVVAARTPGWVRDQFLPYLQTSSSLFPEVDFASTECAAGRIPTGNGEETMDTALPFLSFAAGAMAAAELLKLGLPAYPFSPNRVIFNTQPAIRTVGVGLSQREGCICQSRSLDVHRQMIAGTRLAALSST